MQLPYFRQQEEHVGPNKQISVQSGRIVAWHLMQGLSLAWSFQFCHAIFAPVWKSAPLSVTRCAVRRPAWGSRSLTPLLGVAGSSLTPLLGVAGILLTPCLEVAGGDLGLVPRPLATPRQGISSLPATPSMGVTFGRPSLVSSQQTLALGPIKYDIFVNSPKNRQTNRMTDKWIYRLID